MLQSVDAAQIAVSVVIGVGSGTVAALVTPWTQWAVETRRQQRERRARIIDDARQLVHEGQRMVRRDLLVDPRYLAIRPHLTEETEQKLRAQHETVVEDSYGTGGNYYLGLIRNEADRLAREWKLAE
jgi:riboflavin biosynthesis pyrimidine reductase